MQSSHDTIATMLHATNNAIHYSHNTMRHTTVNTHYYPAHFVIVAALHLYLSISLLQGGAGVHRQHPHLHPGWRDHFRQHL